LAADGGEFSDSAGTIYNGVHEELIEPSNSRDILGDLWAYNYIAAQWTEILPSGISPTPRWGSAFAVFPNKVLLFGGMGTQEPLSELYNVSFSDEENNSAPLATWQQMEYNYTQQIQSLYLFVAFSITQIDSTTTMHKFILYGGLNTPNIPVSGSDSGDGYLYVYDVEKNVISAVRPNGTAPQAYPLVGITTADGFFFYDGNGWTRYTSGICSDGVLALYEECDDGNTNLMDNCEMCYIQLCGNGVVDPGEDCDGGPLCTADCTCPAPFFSDGGYRNGCIPASVPAAFILMVAFPIILFAVLIGIVINFVKFTRRTNKSIVKVLFL